MSQHWIFNEPGSIPGIPGTFANCRVDIDEAGNLLALPLAQHPAMVVTSEVPIVISVDETTPEAKAAPTPDIVQEQAQPAHVPYFNIGG